MKSERLTMLAAAFVLVTFGSASAQSAVPSAAPSVTPTTANSAPPSATPTTAASPAPRQTPTTAMTAQARGEFDAFRSGKVDPTHYSPQLETKITDTNVSDVAKYLQAHGAVKTFTYEDTLSARGHTIYVYRVTCAKPPDVIELIAWDANGKIEGLIFREASP